MAKRLNGVAKWIVVAIAIAGIIFNTAILYNDVKHLKNDITEIKQELKEINRYLLTERSKK